MRVSHKVTLPKMVYDAKKGWAVRGVRRGPHRGMESLARAELIHSTNRTEDAGILASKLERAASKQVRLRKGLMAAGVVALGAGAIYAMTRKKRKES